MREARSRAREARAWLLSKKEEADLREVCERADLDVERVRRVARRVMRGDRGGEGSGVAGHFPLTQRRQARSRQENRDEEWTSWECS